MKNLIKYTIGLPILIVMTIAFILSAIIMAIFELWAGIMGNILFGDRFYSCDIGLDILKEIIRIWQPIGY